MNELIEMGIAGQSKANDQSGGQELIDLGSVVSETKAHNHGTLADATFPTTSP